MQTCLDQEDLYRIIGSQAAEFYPQKSWDDIEQVIRDIWSQHRTEQCWDEAKPAIYASWQSHLRPIPDQ